MAKSKRGGHRRKHKSTKKLTIAKLAKKIDRVSKADRPTYHIIDDTSSDQTFAIPPLTNYISVGTTQLYKYLNLPFGASATQSLTGPYQGTAEGCLIGNLFTAHSVSIRGQCYLVETTLSPTPDLTNAVRVILFWDHAPTIPSIITSPSWNFPNAANANNILGNMGQGSPSVSPAGIYSHYNPAMVGPGKRYKILKDKVFQLTYQGKSQYYFNWKIKLQKKITMMYASLTASYPAQWLGICLVSDSQATPFPVFTMQSRLCYSE